MVVRPDVPAGLEDQARTAAANCPERAILLEDA
jgi:ferredoxin